MRSVFSDNPRHSPGHVNPGIKSAELHPLIQQTCSSLPIDQREILSDYGEICCCGKKNSLQKRLNPLKLRAV